MRALIGFLCISLFVGCAAAEKDNALFKSLDQDNDGLVSFEEYGGDQNEFMSMDQDGDGKLSEAELSAGSPTVDPNNQDPSGDATSSGDAGTLLVTPDTTTVEQPKTSAQQCNEAVNCITTCTQQCDQADQMCADQCMTTCKGEHAEGWPLYETYEGCLMQACGSLTDQAAIQLCVMAAAASGGTCYDSASACGLQGGSGSCSDIYQCLGTCGTDAACQNNCLMQGSSQAISDFDAWNTCLNTACGSVPEAQQGECVNTAMDSTCKPQTDACGVNGGGGAGTCLETTICIVGCPTGDSACQFQCQQEASADGMAQFNAWNNCLNTACGAVPDSEASACVTAAQAEGGACAAETVTCGLIGTSACNDINTCMTTCADTACLYTCIFGGTSNAQTLFGDMNGCFSDNCYQAGQPCSGAGAQTPGCQACQGEFCPEEIAKCQSDGAAGWKKMDNFMPVDMTPAQFSGERLLMPHLPNVFLPYKKN